MKQIAAKDAKNQFGQLLEAAQAAPVRVTKNGRPVGVLMSNVQYDRLRGVAWDRLFETMARIGEEAAQRGLTDEVLEDLLRDES